MRHYLDLIFTDAEFFHSKDDIKSGVDWRTKLRAELAESDFGIICMTPENITSPWILFEAGALSKHLEESRVVPVLFEMEHSMVRAPLNLFQAIKFQKDEILKLALDIQHASGK